MKNILYVSPFAHIGGGELSLVAIINNLDKSIFRPCVVCYEAGAFPDKLKESGIECVILERRFKIFDFFLIFKLLRHIRKNKIDLVHVNSLDIRAGLAARLAGKPLVGHLRVIFPFTWRDRLFVRLSNITIAVSQAVVDAFCGKSPLSKNKFTVIVPLIDIVVGKIKPVDLRKEFNFDKETKLIGLVGRIDPFKGQDIFLRAAKIIKDNYPAVKFFIIGGPAQAQADEAAYLQRLKALVGELGLNNDVVFTGFRSGVLEMMAGLDMLVVPSREIKSDYGAKNEGFGRVAAEAFALGVPVVAAASGGLKEIVEDKVTGLLVASDDYDGLAYAALFILNNEEAARQMVTAAKDKFEKCYSVKNMGLIHKVYSSIVMPAKAGIQDF